ncbi:15-hydroxyprostaglandin dehydrogenase [NAD(+)]-like [Coccinella septempunctata]|uniref:15-hydroxyprostaglandin dehydrogenase [NAD(+)]-like n=1 Tax=Coccinella septempunctata TaxID=41139 RepID=UPI001D087E3C|nr:15-hydroxyprostaglandin dehydrogenase [NAD(+)]-like [Coccinella septempunctata]
MLFEIQGKVALVTGGASGIGLDVCKKLLRDGVRGLTIADINQEVGEKVTESLKREFDSSNVIFVRTDVSNRNSFEEAFKQTLLAFKNVDILVNNAGIFDDRCYEKEIDINFKGAVHGITLGFQKYITENKSGAKGVIVNTASITGTRVYPSMPIYGATKSALVSLTMALGDEIHYERTKVRVVAVAPGFTTTNLGLNRPLTDISLDDDFGKVLEDQVPGYIEQPVNIVGENIIKIIREKPSGTVWISEDEKDIYEYIPSRPTYKPT